MSYLNYSQYFGTHWHPGCLPAPTVCDAIYFVLPDIIVDLYGLFIYHWHIWSVDAE